MRVLSIVLSAGLLASPAVSEGELTGFPANIYDPYCAMACQRSLSSLTLSCSTGGDTVGMVTFETSSACWASNTPYLSSLAWCMHAKCTDVANSKLEYFFETQATGQSTAGVKIVPPKWSYAQALAKSPQPLTTQLTADDTQLNTTSLVAPDVYEKQWNVLTSVQRETTLENGYGIAMLVTGFGTPIVLSMAAYVPYVRRLKPYLVWPSTVGTYQVRPLPYQLGNAPTVGQSLYVAMFLVLNVVLTAVNYRSRQPNAWYATRWREIMAYVLYRTGNFAYITAPLIFLFAGRNNVLLWLTSWSHSTFLVLHRWLARIFALQVLLHSIVAVVLYKEEGMYDMEVSAPYWIWGIVATLCTVVLTFASGLYVRNLAYELFLVVHIALSVLLIVGCWYHAYDLYKFLGGVVDWVYAMSAVWFADRLARVARVAMAGPRRAVVTELGQDGRYVRIDVPGVRWGCEPGQHVYVYFPTLSPLRPWENHPFSVIPTALLHPPHHPTPPPSDDEANDRDPEKHDNADDAASRRLPSSSFSTAGLTLYVRKSAGVTKALRADPNLLVLLEGPYPNNPTARVQLLLLRRCDRLLLVAGGIGITALVPFVLHRHPNVKLAWALRASAACLADDLEPVLRRRCDRDVRIGGGGPRMDVARLLDDEVRAGWARVGVVVSGPGGLCDDVRAAVVEAARLAVGKTEFEIEVEAYSW